MALAAYALPFGLRDVQLVPYNSDTTTENAAGKKDLPAARTFSFTESEEFAQLEGDDAVIAAHGAGPTVDWELESGGISIDVWKILAGGTDATTGITPAIKRTYTKLTTDARPYFKVEGQAISDSGGDLHGIVYRCKADGDLEAEFANGEFTLTAASGKGFGQITSGFKLYEWVHNETAIAIP